MRKAFSLICNQPWAITQDALAQMLAIANRELRDIEAVEAQKAQRLENSAQAQRRGDVAIIPVTGPIFRYANLFSEMSGATSVQILARDFTTALNDASVRAILLNIDSPGGEVNGVNEFANMVYAARGRKPIVAYVGGTGASAAYWIASAADEIVADETAILGSIGVIAAIPRPDAETAEDVVFVSSQSPRKRPDPTTDAGAADIQAVLDATADVFIGAVARNRGVSVEAVLSDYGQGGVFVGQQAVAAELADRLGSFEATLAELVDRPAQAQGTVAQAETPSVHASAPDVPRLAASLPSAAPASRPARADRSRPTTTTEVSMSDLDHTPQAEPGGAPQALDAELSAAEQAKIDRLVALREQEWQAREKMILAEAEARFERRMAEERARQQIESYAQHVTTPTLTRPHALPFEAREVATFLGSLSAEQRKGATALFDRILDAGLVSFEEIGTDGEAAAEQSAQERYQALVNAKVAAGMSAVNAMKAVNREHPDLYAAQTQPKKGGR